MGVCSAHILLSAWIAVFGILIALLFFFPTTQAGFTTRLRYGDIWVNQHSDDTPHVILTNPIIGCDPVAVCAQMECTVETDNAICIGPLSFTDGARCWSPMGECRGWCGGYPLANGFTEINNGCRVKFTLKGDQMNVSQVVNITQTQTARPTARPTTKKPPICPDPVVVTINVTQAPPNASAAALVGQVDDPRCPNLDIEAATKANMALNFSYLAYGIIYLLWHVIGALFRGRYRIIICLWSASEPDSEGVRRPIIHTLAEGTNSIGVTTGPQLEAGMIPSALRRPGRVPRFKWYVFVGELLFILVNDIAAFDISVGCTLATNLRTVAVLGLSLKGLSVFLNLLGIVLFIFAGQKRKTLAGVGSLCVKLSIFIMIPGSLLWAMSTTTSTLGLGIYLCLLAVSLTTFAYIIVRTTCCRPNKYRKRPVGQNDPFSLWLQTVVDKLEIVVSNPLVFVGGLILLGTLGLGVFVDKSTTPVFSPEDVLISTDKVQIEFGEAVGQILDRIEQGLAGKIYVAPPMHNVYEERIPWEPGASWKYGGKSVGQPSITLVQVIRAMRPTRAGINTEACNLTEAMKYVDVIFRCFGPRKGFPGVYGYVAIFNGKWDLFTWTPNWITWDGEGYRSDVSFNTEAAIPHSNIGEATGYAVRVVVTFSESPTPVEIHTSYAGWLWATTLQANEPIMVMDIINRVTALRNQLAYPGFKYADYGYAPVRTVLPRDTTPIASNSSVGRKLLSYRDGESGIGVSWDILHTHMAVRINKTVDRRQIPRIKRSVSTSHRLMVLEAQQKHKYSTTQNAPSSAPRLTGVLLVIDVWMTEAFLSDIFSPIKTIACGVIDLFCGGDSGASVESVEKLQDQITEALEAQAVVNDEFRDQLRIHGEEITSVWGELAAINRRAEVMKAENMETNARIDRVEMLIKHNKMINQAETGLAKVARLLLCREIIASTQHTVMCPDMDLQTIYLANSKSQLTRMDNAGYNRLPPPAVVQTSASVVGNSFIARVTAAFVRRGAEQDWSRITLKGILSQPDSDGLCEENMGPSHVVLYFSLTQKLRYHTITGDPAFNMCPQGVCKEVSGFIMKMTDEETEILQKIHDTPDGLVELSPGFFTTVRVPCKPERASRWIFSETTRLLHVAASGTVPYICTSGQTNTERKGILPFVDGLASIQVDEESHHCVITFPDGKLIVDIPNTLGGNETFHTVIGKIVGVLPPADYSLNLGTIQMSSLGPNFADAAIEAEEQKAEAIETFLRADNRSAQAIAVFRKETQDVADVEIEEAETPDSLKSTMAIVMSSIALVVSILMVIISNRKSIGKIAALGMAATPQGAALSAGMSMINSQKKPTENDAEQGNAQPKSQPAGPPPSSMPSFPGISRFPMR